MLLRSIGVENVEKTLCSDLKNPTLLLTASSQDEWEEQTEKSGPAFISSSNLTLE